MVYLDIDSLEQLVQESGHNLVDYFPTIFEIAKELVEKDPSKAMKVWTQLKPIIEMYKR